MGELRAVVFDVDGTLVDSEQQGHRPAFNAAFAERGVADEWDEGTYRRLLAVTGGERRLLTWFDDPRSSVATSTRATKTRLAAAVHRTKTERFRQLAIDGAIPGRPGARRLLDELAAAGVPVGVATTGSRRWVEPLLDARFGLERFGCVVTGDDVVERKPSGEAYVLALARLGLDARGCVAVEDSGPGVAAALDAGLPCVVVANEDTDAAAVAGADLVLDGYAALTPEVLARVAARSR